MFLGLAYIRHKSEFLSKFEMGYIRCMCKTKREAVSYMKSLMKQLKISVNYKLVHKYRLIRERPPNKKYTCAGIACMFTKKKKTKQADTTLKYT